MARIHARIKNLICISQCRAWFKRTCGGAATGIAVNLFLRPPRAWRVKFWRILSEQERRKRQTVLPQIRPFDELACGADFLGRSVLQRDPQLVSTRLFYRM